MVLIRNNPPEFLSAGAWSTTRLFRPLALGHELTHFFLSQVVALLPGLDTENEGDRDSSATDVRVPGVSFQPPHRWKVLLSFLTCRRRWLDCSFGPHFFFFFFLRSLLEEAESQRGEVIGENISALRNTNSWHFVNAAHVPRPVLGTRTYLHQVITWFPRGSWTSVCVCVCV